MDYLSNILEASLKGLKSIQSEFDIYQKGYFPERIPAFFSLELCGEAGELANAEKKLWKGKNIDKGLIEDEAADVFITLMNYCNSRDIDLGKAVKNKLEIIDGKRLKLNAKGEDY